MSDNCCSCGGVLRLERWSDVVWDECDKCGAKWDERHSPILGVSPRPPHKCHPEDMLSIKGMIYTCLKCSVCGQEYDIESTHPRVVSTPYPMGKVD
jgi:ribosomal protein L37AE/L43A